MSLDRTSFHWIIRLFIGSYIFMSSDRASCHCNTSFCSEATFVLLNLNSCHWIVAPIAPYTSCYWYGGAFCTKLQSYRHLHSIGSYLCSAGSYFHSIGLYFHSIGSFLSSIRSYFNYFVASYITLAYSSVAFHIYPYLRGNSIPSDRN